MKTMRMLVIGLGVLAATGLFADAARAESYTWTLPYIMDGGQQPEGSLTVTVTDLESGGVKITLTLSDNATNDATEKVCCWYLNSTKDLSGATVTYVAADSVGDGNPLQGWSYAADGNKADGDPNKYDFVFDFDTATGNSFESGETVVFTITGVDGLTASDFATTNGTGSYSAAHVLSIGTGNTSTWLHTIPEPGTILLLGLGLAGGAVGARRRRRG